MGGNNKAWEDDTKVFAAPRRKKRASTKRLLWIILAFVAIAAIVAVIVAVSSMYSFMKEIGTVEEVEMPVPEPGDRVNILVLGLDGGVNGKLTLGAQRTDTMMLVSLDTELNEIGVLSIPRDTRVEIPGRPTYEKVNHAHAYGGAQLAVDTVASFLEVPIHFFVRVDFQGFIKMVDTVGGVEMYIPRDMVYSDPEQNLYINIKAGDQVLNGAKALEFVRYRQYTDADIGRVKAQQQFLDALLGKFFQTRNMLKISSLASDLAKCVDTNLQPGDILSLARFAAQMEPDGLKMGMIPGRDAILTDGGLSLSYWVADQSEMAKVVDEVVKGIDREANSKVRVRLVNGTGSDDGAQGVADHLRSEGFRVSIAEQSAFVDRTEVVVFKGDARLAKMIGRSLGRLELEPTVYERSTEDAEWDLVITLGSDLNR